MQMPVPVPMPVPAPVLVLVLVLVPAAVLMPVPAAVLMPVPAAVLMPVPAAHPSGRFLPPLLHQGSSRPRPRQSRLGVTLLAALHARRAALAAKGVRIEEVPADNGFLDLFAVLKKLGDLEMNEVLVEAGPTLAGQCSPRSWWTSWLTSRPSC